MWQQVPEEERHLTRIQGGGPLCVCHPGWAMVSVFGQMTLDAAVEVFRRCN